MDFEIHQATILAGQAPRLPSPCPLDESKLALVSEAL
jgi:hypothetical protein